jgi:PAS domain S-box-containing protein
MQMLVAPASLARWLPPRRALVIAALFVVSYVLLAWATRSYLVRPFGITPWNPSAGLALALLLVFGVRFWPALAVATFLSALLTRGIPPPPYIQLLAPVAVTVGYIGMAAWLRGPLGFRVEFDRFRDVSMLVAVAAVGTLLVAIAFVFAIQPGKLTSETGFYSTVLRSWIGHLIGIVINTPLLLMLANWPRMKRMLRRWSPAEIAVQFCAVILTLWIVFGSGWSSPYKLFYLLFLPLMWIAVRHAIVGAMLGINVIQLGLIVAVAHSDSHGEIAVTELQFMMLALAVTGLVLGMVVAEMRDASAALNESESRLRAIVSTAPDSIITVDQQGYIVATNPAAAQVFDYATRDMIGKPVIEMLPEFESVALIGEVCELTGVRSSGARFPVEISVGTTKNRVPELRIAVTRDITRRKAMECQLDEKQAEVHRSARLAAAGEMAAALAHELHQPLSAIRNYARAATMLSPAAGAGDLLKKVEREAARAAEVVRRLRNFFRGGVSRRERLGVRQLVDGALAPMREQAAQQRITLETSIAADDADLQVDRVQTETVIHSLVGNAMEAIAASNAPRRCVRITTDGARDGWVRCSVEDTGPGISAAIADRLFEPFATTKATGIGLGLAMSRSMIESHGGKLWAERGSGGGTVFHFSLPVAGARVARRASR